MSLQKSTLTIRTPSTICSCGMLFAPVSIVTSRPSATSSLDVSRLQLQCSGSGIVKRGSSYICRIFIQNLPFYVLCNWSLLLSQIFGVVMYSST
jgi:hypothetical protein